MIHYDVAKKFSKYPGGRKISHGAWSGEQFLLEVLVPFWEQWNKDKETVRFDFTGCMGVTHGFLDESFGELASLFGAAAILARFEILGERSTLMQDFDNVLLNGEKAGKIETPMCNQVKATAAQRRAVQDFMEWCAGQEPRLVLAQVRGYASSHDSHYEVDWQKYCTEWCEVDEDKLEQEKMLILERLRAQQDLFARSRERREKKEKQKAKR